MTSLTLNYSSEKSLDHMDSLLSTLLNDLKTKTSEDEKLHAAKQLQNYVTSQSRDRSPENYKKWMKNFLKVHISQLINSAFISEKIGGLIAIDALIDVAYDEFISIIANYYRFALKTNDANVLTWAARAIGHMSRINSTITAECVEFDMQRALEWLQGERQEGRRHASCLVLKELATNSPTLFYGYANSFMDLIWVVLRDSKLQIRECALEALEAALVIIAERESRFRLQWYQKVYEEAQRGLSKPASQDIIHASLGALGALVENSGDFLKDKFNNVAQAVMKLKDSKEKLLKKTVISILPKLAEFSPELFRQNYLETSVNYLLVALRKDFDCRPAAFVSLGKIAIVVKESILPFVENITKILNAALNKKEKTPLNIDAVECSALLAEALGTHFQDFVTDKLDWMIRSGLSEVLIRALSQFSKYIPQLSDEIHEKLLDMISVTLSGKPFNLPGTPNKHRKLQPAVSTPTPGTLPTKEEIEKAVTLAFHTLGDFGFDPFNLLELLRDTVVSFLKDPNLTIRREAAMYCCQMLSGGDLLGCNIQYYMNIINEAVEKLVALAVSDADSYTRLTVLSSFDEKWDIHLSQPANVRYLFIALNDELFEIKFLALGLICRVSEHNPACVMPSLRKTLIQLLTELESSSDSLLKEESSKLLGLLISSAPILVKPYIKPLMQSLLPKLQDSDSGVSSSVLSTVGELASVTGSEMREHMPFLIPLIIDTLQDQSSHAKREVAIRTLGQVVEHTGYVITPFVNYPKLLDTILNLLQTEVNTSVRTEIIKVLGIIGALDPYKHKLNELLLEGRKNDEDGTGKMFKAENKDSEMTIPPTNSDDYYPTVTITALIRILKDPSLTQHHTLVIHALMFIVKSLGSRFIHFLPHIMPPFLQIMRISEPEFRSTLFQQLGVLVSRVKQHIRDYLPDLFALIQEYFRTSNIIYIIGLIEEISSALGDEFRQYVSITLPLLLQVLHENDENKNWEAVAKTLRAINTLHANLGGYIHMLVPVVVKLCEFPDVPRMIRKDALATCANICKKFNITVYASRILHPLTRTLESNQAIGVQSDIMDVICAVAKQLGKDYLIFSPMVDKVILKQHISHPRYEVMMSELVTEQVDTESSESSSFSTRSSSESAPEDPIPYEAASLKRIKLNEQNLRRAWEISEGATKEDWWEWLRQLSVALLRESPSPALRSCISVANDYYPLVKELFNAAFISCWSELSEGSQEELVRNLEIALTSPNIPPALLQTLLNLAEFMEQDEKPLPIDTKTLDQLAEKCHAYAKALHYREMEFRISPLSTIEALISVYNQLQQPQAALGILSYAQKYHNVQLKESWYEKLQRWDLALKAYERRHEDVATNVLGRMRCLKALGEWERVVNLAEESWGLGLAHTARAKMASLAASASWSLSQWDTLKKFSTTLDEKTVDGGFFRAVLAIHADQYSEAKKFISITRKLIDPDLSALVRESYGRAYGMVVKVQHLAELEEIIEFKQNPERRPLIVTIWDHRLHACERSVDTWQSILLVRSLVLNPIENMKSWMKFANLCRKNGRLDLSHKVLVELLGTDPSFNGNSPLPMRHPRVTYGYIKQLWDSGETQRAFDMMKRFPVVKGDTQLQSRIFLMMGQWQCALEGMVEDTIPQIMHAFQGALEYDSNSNKAWHAWALGNYEAVSYYEKLLSQLSNVVEPPVSSDANSNTESSYTSFSTSNRQTLQKKLMNHVVPAITGFFRSIASSTNQNLQDTLRLLTLWFKHGAMKEVQTALTDGFNSVSIDTWLQVIPQIIARIHSPVTSIKRLIHELLNSIGKVHPQALIYPLTVAMKSQSAARISGASSVMDKMKKHSGTLVEQAMLVSNELIRVSILWFEMWLAGLEEASRCYFGDHNAEGMLEILKPLHEMMEKGPETQREEIFHQEFGRDLQEALDWCRRWERSRRSTDLNQAWELYYKVFRKTNKLVTQLTALDLQQVSPKLAKVKDLELAVPGTYRAGQPVVKIRSFNATLPVFQTKQHPRKIFINSSDGDEYLFLLKGHEDLRQDERVMQLFGLVNTLLSADYETSKNHLSIKRYSVVPLSPNSGLLGWMLHCDTLHQLIREYRDHRKIWINIEHRLMLQMAPDYEKLTLMQQVESFQYALDNTNGQDLERILWLKSANAEVWLDRRTNYTRSLAVMSMVGYILGLGDRHPSNIMLDRHTGNIVHIDFGDCFEVAMHREKYPEKIPFRLTRMLVNAMEVSGLEGTFRYTCENVMRVLRQNKESLMAVLEAFVYDPLINWRLLTPTSPEPNRNENNIPAYGVSGAESMPEVLNRRALKVIDRVNKKLTGKDFGDHESPLDIPEQIQRLVNQASSHENLCQCYIGWCPFW